MSTANNLIVSAAGLGRKLQTGKSKVLALDGTLFLPNSPYSGAPFKTPYEKFQHSNLSTSLLKAGGNLQCAYWDLNVCAGRTNRGLPHQMPTRETFRDYIHAELPLNLNSIDEIVVYDSFGMFSAARLWVTLKHCGHEGPVSILDGGLPAWERYNRGEEQDSQDSTNKYTTVATTSMIPKVVGREFVLEQINSSSSSSSSHFQIVDARSGPRFRGEVAETRPGLRSGHMPGAVNIPFTDVLDSNTGMFLSAEVLREQVFGPNGNSNSGGIDLNKPILTTCGSGVTACVVVAAAQIARENLPVQDAIYDGSWSEWGCEKTWHLEECPVVK